MSRLNRNSHTQDSLDLRDLMRELQRQERNTRYFIVGLTFAYSVAFLFFL